MWLWNECGPAYFLQSVCCTPLCCCEQRYCVSWPRVWVFFHSELLLLVRIELTLVVPIDYSLYTQIENTMVACIAIVLSMCAAVVLNIDLSTCRATTVQMPTNDYDDDFGADAPHGDDTAPSSAHNNPFDDNPATTDDTMGMHADDLMRAAPHAQHQHSRHPADTYALGYDDEDVDTGAPQAADREARGRGDYDAGDAHALHHTQGWDSCGDYGVDNNDATEPLSEGNASCHTVTTNVVYVCHGKTLFCKDVTHPCKSHAQPVLLSHAYWGISSYLEHCLHSAVVFMWVRDFA